MNDALHDYASQTGFSGGENLAIMQEARNYNAYLRSLVIRYAGNADSALDFGAGIGTFSDSLGIAPQRVFCVEPDGAAREVLSQKGYSAVADLAQLDDQCVPYAFTLNVLEHIEDDAAIVAELFRVLQPGGRLFVYVPAFNVLYTSMDALVGHHRRYRRNGLASLLEGAGFVIEKTAYTDVLGFFATLAYKVVDRRKDGALNARSVRLYDRLVFPASRILSTVFASLLGKNLYIVASRPASPA